MSGAIGGAIQRCPGCGGPMARGIAGNVFCQTCVHFGARADKQPDPVNPSHYVKRGIEVRHVIRAFECTYNVGTAVAYLLRAPFKGRYLEDIRKAIQHLTFELEDKGGGGDGVDRDRTK